MKSISPIKFFTAVGFLVVSLTGLNLLAQNLAQAAQQKTQSEVEIEFCGDKKNITNPKWKKVCEETSASDCTSALKDFKDAQSKASGACESFAKTTESKDGKNTCENRMRSCRDKITSGADSTSPNGSQDLMNTMLGIYMQQKYPGQNANDIPLDKGTSGRSCSNYKSKDERKDQKTDKKDVEKEIKQLNKDIAEEKKKINEENAKLREKNTEIDSEIQKVDEAMKKAIRSVDQKKAENLKKLNDDLAKNGISIRNLNSEIIKMKEAAESAKFDYGQRMMQFAEDKVSAQCNAATDTAKQCFLKSSKGLSSADPKDVCGGFTFNGKGAKGTAQLKAKIQKVREACFEQANASVNKAKFEQSKSLRTLETGIIEKTNQVQDANNDITQKQKNMKSEDDAADKERTEEEKIAEKQIDNFKKKLESISKSTQDAIMHSNEKMAQFQKEIDDAKTRQLAVKMGVLEPEALDTSLQDAEEVIGTREAAREQAITACCPKEKPIDLSKKYSKEELKNIGSSVCTGLITGSSKQEDKKGYSTTPATSQ
jgi:hypothetical protein